MVKLTDISIKKNKRPVIPKILLWCNALVVMPFFIVLIDLISSGGGAVANIILLVLLGPITLVTLFIDVLWVIFLVRMRRS